MIIQCPNCKADYEVDGSLDGSEMKCSNCQKIFTASARKNPSDIPSVIKPQPKTPDVSQPKAVTPSPYTYQNSASAAAKTQVNSGNGASGESPARRSYAADNNDNGGRGKAGTFFIVLLLLIIIALQVMFFYPANTRYQIFELRDLNVPSSLVPNEENPEDWQLVSVVPVFPTTRGGTLKYRGIYRKDSHPVTEFLRKCIRKDW